MRRERSLANIYHNKKMPNSTLEIYLNAFPAIKKPSWAYQTCQKSHNVDPLIETYIQVNIQSYTVVIKEATAGWFMYMLITWNNLGASANDYDQ